MGAAAVLGSRSTTFPWMAADCSGMKWRVWLDGGSGALIVASFGLAFVASLVNQGAHSAIRCVAFGLLCLGAVVQLGLRSPKLVSRWIHRQRR